MEKLETILENISQWVAAQITSNGNDGNEGFFSEKKKKVTMLYKLVIIGYH